MILHTWSHLREVLKTDRDSRREEFKGVFVLDAVVGSTKQTPTQLRFLRQNVRGNAMREAGEKTFYSHNVHKMVQVDV